MPDYTNAADMAARSPRPVAVTGDPDTWALICKAALPGHHGWAKSTKRMAVDGGALYQVTTQYLDADGAETTACAEALAFVPDPPPAAVSPALARLAATPAGRVLVPVLSAIAGALAALGLG